MGNKRNHNRSEKYLEMNENENATCRNLWNLAKAVPRGKVIAINIFIKKETSKINNLTIYLEELGEQIKTKTSSRKKKIIKIGADLKKKIEN